MRRNRIVAGLAIGIAFVAWVAMAFLAVAEQSGREVVANPSELSWGGSAVACLEPNGTVYAEISYWPARERHHARVFGHCNSSSFEAFAKEQGFDTRTNMYDLSDHLASLWNKEASVLAPDETRRIVPFAEGDQAFKGRVRGRDGVIVEMLGVYSSTTGYFVIDVHSLSKGGRNGG